MVGPDDLAVPIASLGPHGIADHHQAEVEEFDNRFEPLIDDGRDDLPRSVGGNDLPDAPGGDTQLGGDLRC